MTESQRSNIERDKLIQDGKKMEIGEIVKQNERISYNFLKLFACPTANFVSFWGDSITQPILITAFLHFCLEGHQKPCNGVGLLCLAKFLVEFEPGTFWFW